MTLKIVSFNMKRTNRKNNWARRMEAIVAFFDREKPDVVGTQELLYANIKAAERRLPEYSWVGEGRRGGYASEYTAIFYRNDRLSLIDWGMFWLSRKPNKPGSRAWFAAFPRTCTWAVFESLCDKGRIKIYNTHLDNISSLARTRGLELIRSHICENPIVNTVLMGDFNAPPNSRAVRTDGQSIFIQTNDVLGRTYHGFLGKIAGRPIDYILALRGMEILSCYIDRHTYQNRYPSDHYPVVMVVNTVSSSDNA